MSTVTNSSNTQENLNQSTVPLKPIKNKINLNKRY